MKEIIEFLRKGKRVNVSEIAREIDLPISTVSDRIKKIEQRYVLKRSSLLDFPKLGYNVNAVIFVKAKKDFLEFQKKEKDCINSIYQIDKDYDYMIEIVCKDMLEFKEFVSFIEDKVEEYKVFQIIRTIEKEKFLGGKKNES